MWQRSGPVNILRKNFYFKYQKCDRSGPVELCEKNARIYKMLPQVQTCEYFEKKTYF